MDLDALELSIVVGLGPSAATSGSATGSKADHKAELLAWRKACKHSFAVAAQLMTDELVQDAHILVTVTKSYWHAHGLVGQSKKQPSQHASWARQQALGEWCSEVRTSP